MKKYSTKRALIASILMLALCCSALLGTTYAWFTDSVTSSGNVIQSGTLKIGFDKWDGTKWVDATNAPVFDYDKWEPGYIQNVNLRVTNLGTLALKWQAVITTENSLSKLADVIDVYVNAWGVLDDASASAVTAPIDRNLTGYTLAGTLADFVENLTTTTYGTLLKGENAYLGIALKMKEEAGNEYQGLDLGGKFDLTILATQNTYEKDSFDEKYDANAEFSYVAAGKLPVEAGKSDYQIDLINPKGGKSGSAVIDSDSVADNASEVSIIVIETNPNANVTLETDQGARTFEVNAYGLDANNTTPVKVSLTIGKGYTGVKLYHYTDEVTNATYDPNKGTITFTTNTFSPFTVVFDAAGAEVEEPTDSTALKAIVKDKDEYEHVNLEWKSFGPFSALPLGYQLESVYEFSAPHTSETVGDSIYKDWYCDYYVMMDRDVEEGALVLGGNYGQFGWVGFESPAAPGNTEIPLLGVALDPENPRVDVMTYESVVNFVQVFLCGVAHMDESLNGATFTVKLRLTNPDNYDNYFDAAEVSYTFDNTLMKVEEVSSSTELDTAIADGATSIILSSGTYEMPDSVSGKDITITGNGSTVVSVVDDGGAEGDIDYSLEGANVVFENLTLNVKGSDHPGYARIASATYNNCTIKGANFCLYGKSVFNNCTFDLNNGYVWTWGAPYVEFNNCTFNDTTGGAAKAILVHNTTETVVYVRDCTFNATTTKTTWDGIPVAAVSIDPENGSPDATVYFEGTNTCSDAFNGLYQVKYADETDDVKVYVNDVLDTNVPVGENDK